MLDKFLEPFFFKKLEKAALLYREKEFRKIISHYDKPILCDQPSDVFTNLFRICCLIHERNSLWEKEYLASLKSGEFDKFLSEPDKNYIQFYIYSSLKKHETEQTQYNEFEMSEVSERMKRYFPYSDLQSKIFSNFRSL